MKSNDIKEMLEILKDTPEERKSEILKSIDGVLAIDFENILKKVYYNKIDITPYGLLDLTRELTMNLQFRYGVYQKLKEMEEK